jgi:hypothetical protein
MNAKIINAMDTLRTSLANGGASESQVNTKITDLVTEIGRFMIPFATGNTQLLIDEVNSSSVLTTDEKTQFITDIS